jgi:precorrin-2 dehydrogenase
MENKTDLRYFPINLDMTKFKVLVIGGGTIASRKVDNVVQFGAKPKVIAPEISGFIRNHHKQGNITHAKREYKHGDCKGFNLVFVATGIEEVDKEVHEECEKLGVLLNVADVPPLCNFIMPATITRGLLTFSIGSQGRSPFMVREMRKKLDRELSPMLGETAQLAAELRDMMLDSGIYYKSNLREEMIQEFMKTNWDAVIYYDGIKAAREIIHQLYLKYEKLNANG